jgi:chemotaxis protein methyltransferase CheR
MWPGPSTTLELPASVFTILRDLIHEQTGLHYDDSKRELLAEKLSPLASERGFGSYLDYYYLLKYGPGSEEEWPRLIDALSVQETYFWREIGQIQALVTKLLPEHVARSPRRTVRIWCAACATGEEPLTIAMALEEAGWFARAEIQIHASDASPAALSKARRGIYRERSFRALPGQLRAKYFLSTEDGWQIRSDLSARVTWSLSNLVEDAEISKLATVPFIFCRNVFIYFSQQTIARTVHSFANCMERPGYLFVGAAESLLRLTDAFKLTEAGDAFVYVLD